MDTTNKRWDSETHCKMCDKLCDGLLCEECIEKLQTSYGQLCLGCGNHKFIDWTEENVHKLCETMGWHFDIVWNVDRIVIVPYSICPECCDDKELCQHKGKKVIWDY